jgi:hypothetical protein
MSNRSHSEHAVRAARTQATFRDLNERVREISDGVGETAALGDRICECASDDCTERIALAVDEYENLRSQPTRFAVAPSERHVFFEVENVVDQTERYWVVEKIGEGARLAASVDPGRVGLLGRPEPEAAPH